MNNGISFENRGGTRYILWNDCNSKIRGSEKPKGKLNTVIGTKILDNVCKNEQKNVTS